MKKSHIGLLFVIGLYANNILAGAEEAETISGTEARQAETEAREAAARLARHTGITSQPSKGIGLKFHYVPEPLPGTTEFHIAPTPITSPSVSPSGSPRLQIPTSPASTQRPSLLSQQIEARRLREFPEGNAPTRQRRAAVSQPISPVLEERANRLNAEISKVNEHAMNYFKTQSDINRELAALKRVPTSEASQKIENYESTKKELEPAKKELDSTKRKMLEKSTALKGKALNEAEISELESLHNEYQNANTRFQTMHNQMLENLRVPVQPKPTSVPARRESSEHPLDIRQQQATQTERVKELQRKLESQRVEAMRRQVHGVSQGANPEVPKPSLMATIKSRVTGQPKTSERKLSPSRELIPITVTKIKE